jgi:hypothetical protein
VYATDGAESGYVEYWVAVGYGVLSCSGASSGEMYDDELFVPFLGGLFEYG